MAWIGHIFYQQNKSLAWHNPPWTLNNGGYLMKPPEMMLKWWWRHISEWGTKKFRGRSTIDDAMPSSPYSALFSCALTYSFLIFTFNNRHIGLSAFTVFILLRWFGTELPDTSYELRVESLKSRVETQNCKFKSMNYEFKSTSYEFKSTSYEFKSASCEFKSTTYEFKSTSNEFKSTSFEYDFTSYEFKSTNWNENSRKQLDELVRFWTYIFGLSEFLWRDLQSIGWSCIFFKIYF